MSADEVLSLVGTRLLSGELPEMGALAAETGVGRTTLFRWFGDRDSLIATVMANNLEQMIEQGYCQATGTGGQRIGEAIESLLTGSATEPLLSLLRKHPETMLKVIMSPDGEVHTRSISSLTRLIEREQQTGHYKPLLDPREFAFVLVQVGQAFMWGRATTGTPPDLKETMRVTTALLTSTTKAPRR
jgi:AcrR family transcriptional regulator